MRRIIVIGTMTPCKSELGEIVYFGNDADEAEKAYKNSEYYRYQFFQADLFIKQKFKEENRGEQLATVIDKGQQGATNDSSVKNKQKGSGSPAKKTTKKTAKKVAKAPNDLLG